jgi:hypothetical protein
MSKWLWGLGLAVVLTVQGFCAGYYTEISERWFKPPTQIGFYESPENLYIGDAAIDPVTGYLLVLDGAKYGNTMSTWSTKVNPNDTVSIAVLDPVSGQFYGKITSIPFVDGWGVSPTRIAVSEDGVVLVHGYEGSVLRISSATTFNATGSPKVLSPGAFRPEDPSTPLYGGSMGFSVIGKYKEGRCYIVDHRGNTFFLYKNSPGDIDHFGLIRFGTIAYNTVSNSSEIIQGLEMTNDLRTVYTYRGAGNGIRKFAGEPFGGYSRETSFSSAFNWESSMDWDPAYNLIAVAGLHNDVGTGTDTTKDYIRVCFQNLQGQPVGTGNISAGVYSHSSTPRVNSELRVGIAIDTTLGNIFAVSNCGIIKFAGSRVTTPPPAQDSTPVIVPKPQFESWQNDSLKLTKFIIPEPHYADVSTRIARATLALRQFLQPASPAGSIPLYLGVVGYDSTVAQRCAAEGITVPNKAEAYALSVSSSGITVIGNDLPGLFHGIMTLHQMKQYSNPAILRYGKVQDYPCLSYRGIHTFTGKNALTEQKRLIDMLALWKINNIVLQIDYMEYKNHPEIYYAPWGQSQADVAEYIKYANDRFIEVAPLVNGPGHFEWAFRNGYHWDLAEDSTPTSGYPYVYCITYDSTYVFLYELYDEVVNLFKPKFFHIGHDEVYSTEGCNFPERSVGYTTRELMEMDFAKVSQYFANKNINLMFWGDMILHSSESPGAANADTYTDATGMRANLKKIEANAGYPKYYIADWHYGASAPSTYGSLTVFKAEGYPTIPSPWYDHDNIRNLTLAGIQQESFGLLQTTWAGFNFSIEANTGSYYQFEAYPLAADYSWSGRQDYIVDLKYSPKTLFWNQWNTLKAGNETVISSDLTGMDDWYLMD